MCMFTQYVKIEYTLENKRFIVVSLGCKTWPQIIIMVPSLFNPSHGFIASFYLTYCGLTLFFSGRCGNNLKSMLFKLMTQLDHLLWNCFQVNATKPHQCEVNINSGKGLSAIRQRAIIWVSFDPYLCRHMALLGHNESEWRGVVSI